MDLSYFGLLSFYELVVDDDFRFSYITTVYMFQVCLSQLWGISTSKIASSFGGLVGCFIILVSVCYTIYDGPEKETDEIQYSLVD